MDRKNSSEIKIESDSSSSESENDSSSSSSSSGSESNTPLKPQKVNQTQTYVRNYSADPCQAYKEAWIRRESYWNGKIGDNDWARQQYRRNGWSYN